MKPLEDNAIEVNPWADFSKNINKYQSPSLRKSIWQIANTFIPYIGLWIAIIYSFSISWWLTAFLIILASGFLVRLFIIFHDCGHGSFFKSRSANETIGKLFGILAFTPYYKWHNQHLRHHANVGNLDKRGEGDVWTLTKAEYLASSKWGKLKYRVYRHPLIMFGIGSLYVFLIQNRMTSRRMTQKEKRNIYFTNASLLLICVVMSLIIGFANFLIIQLLILYISAVGGLYLFYMQHQFEDVTWFRSDTWNYRSVALEGSSFVKFPKLLQWFSGNIGFHHIHHLNSRIPNYNLARCYRENKVFRDVTPVTFLKSFSALKLRLWDEQLQRLVSFRSRNLINYS